MDTRFSVAVHALILIAEADIPLTSAQIAGSAGVNPSYVRRVLASLRNAGIISAHRGVRGFALCVEPASLSLLAVYRAVTGGGPALFDVHQNPNDRCVVGRHIRPVLGGMFQDLENALSLELGEKTLKDCVDAVNQREHQN